MINQERNRQELDEASESYEAVGPRDIGPQCAERAEREQDDRRARSRMTPRGTAPALSTVTSTATTQSKVAIALAEVDQGNVIATSIAAISASSSTAWPLAPDLE